MNDLIDRLNYKARKQMVQNVREYLLFARHFYLNELYLFNEFEYSII